MLKRNEPLAIGIVGAGTMGSQIAALFSFIGHRVLVFDVVAPANFKQTVSRWHRLLGRDEKLVSLRLAEPGNYSFVATIEELAGSELLIECIAENGVLKASVLSQLEKMIRPDAILATNTSSLSVHDIAASLSCPDRLIGLHFFNPIHAVPLVEVCIPSPSSPEFISGLTGLLEGLGRTVVVCPDIPGFIVNRLLFLMIASAIQMVEHENVAPEAVDIAMKKGANLPVGPLELADMIGLDVCLMILRTLHLRTGTAVYAPPRLLEELVNAGHLGKKTGQGFYSKIEKL